MDTQILCNATRRVNSSWLRAMKTCKMMQTGTFMKKWNLNTEEFKHVLSGLLQSHIKIGRKPLQSFRWRKHCCTEHMVAQTVRLNMILDVLMGVRFHWELADNTGPPSRFQQSPLTHSRIVYPQSSANACYFSYFKWPTKFVYKLIPSFIHINIYCLEYVSSHHLTKSC